MTASRNFSLFCNHITIVPTIKAILDSPDLHLDGFLGPGHVGDGDRHRALRIHRPATTASRWSIAGFEPLDVLQSIWMVLKQIAEGRCEIENQYAPHRPGRGNAAALARRRRGSTSCANSSNGAGSARSIIPACRIRAAYARFDAERKFAVPNVRIADPKSCQCGEVLKGVIKPWQCKVFGTACTPETPLGALMVSSEGACAAYYQYGGIRGNATRRGSGAA